MMFEKIRKAKLKDAQQIYELINRYAQDDLMLPRSLNEIYEFLRDFWVFEFQGRICGCCALHIIGWDDMAEIKCFAVEAASQKKGMGTKLVNLCLKEAAALGINKVFVLTYISDYFKRLGFQDIDNKLHLCISRSVSPLQQDSSDSCHILSLDFLFSPSPI